MRKRLVLAGIVMLTLTSLACSLGGVLDDKTGNLATAVPSEATETGPTQPSQPTATPEKPGSTPAATPESVGGSGAAGIPVEERLAALDDVRGFLGDLSGSDRDADNRAIVEYLNSRDEFAGAGVSTDATVWAEFTDGRMLAIFSNLELSDGEADASDAGAWAPATLPPHRPAAWSSETTLAYQLPVARPVVQETAVQLPTSDQARLLVALGTHYERHDAAPALGSLLAATGYHPAPGAEATVSGLKKVSGDGVFYFNTHGGLLSTMDGEPAYALLTRTPINSYNETLLRSDIVAGRVVYAVAKHDRNPTYDPKRDPPGRAALWEYHYGITSEFVREYMSFAEGSFVYVRACSSDFPEMRHAFLDKGAGAYAGWSKTVYSDDAYRATMFLFDRLLGTNQVPPLENPKQRPFDLRAIYVNLRERNLHKSRSSELNVSTRTGGSVILVPSVAYLEVREESDELFIFGLFGPEEGEVTINGTPAELGRWEQDLVSVRLPADGAGSAGDVVVKVREHQSNAVPLTEWRGEIRYTFISRLPAPNLRTEVVIQAHFRADVHPFRKKPGQPPVERKEIRFALAGDATAEWQMTGHVSVEGATFDLEGGGVLPLRKYQPDDNLGHFGVIGTLKPQGILQGKPPILTGVDFHIHTTGDPPEGKLKMRYRGGSQESGYPISQTDVLSDLELRMEPDFGVKAGQRQSSTIAGHEGMGTGTLQWETLKASFAPDLTDLPHAMVPRPQGLPSG